MILSLYCSSFPEGISNLLSGVVRLNHTSIGIIKETLESHSNVTLIFALLYIGAKAAYVKGKSSCSNHSFEL